VAEIAAGGYRGVVISPGPGEPKGAGVSLAAIRELGGKLPILGVCLGHQAIGEAFGGRIVRAPQPIHGKASRVKHDGCGIFAGVPEEIEVGRYHSLVIEPATCPQVLEITATTADGIIMGVRHRTLPIEGVQFHPESVLTGSGMQILSNFVRLCAAAPVSA
jgi:anthranilate synthase component 2